MGIEEGFRFKKHFKSNVKDVLLIAQEEQLQEEQPQEEQLQEEQPQEEQLQEEQHTETHLLETNYEGAYEIYGLKIQSNTDTIKSEMSKKSTATSKPSSSPKLKIPIINLKEF